MAPGSASAQARGGTADELQEVQITPRYVGPGAEIANARLDNNPINVIRSGSNVSPDDLRLIESITVEGQRIRQGDDPGLDQWYFLNQYYRPYLTPQGQGLVDDARYAAEANYRMVQRYGRTSPSALHTIGSTYDLLTATSAGTGAANLALGYNGGPASLTEKIIGAPIGFIGGGLEGLFRGTAGAAEFTGDAVGATLYEMGGGDFFAPSYERYGATAAGLVDLANNPGAIVGAVGDYFSRIGNLYGVDPLNASSMLGRPVGEVVAPGVELMSVARGLRIGGEYALDSAAPLLDALKQLEFTGSADTRLLANQIGAVGDLTKLRRTIDVARVYEAQIRDLYSGAPGGPREFRVLMDGALVNGEADFVTRINGQPVAVEAKFVDDWLESPRNPNSPQGQLEFLKHMQTEMVSQARIYQQAFPGGTIYHSNSIDLINHYTRVFADAGINNVQFVHTPLRGVR